MAYISTKLKREFQIDELVTIHYFEYMKKYSFPGESHNFWEIVYVDKGELAVFADTTLLEVHTGDMVFHRPNEFHSFYTIGDRPPNIFVISFICESPFMDFFEKKKFHLSAEERNLISLIISESLKAFSCPLHIPSIQSLTVSNTAPVGSQHLILLYLEHLLLILNRNYNVPQVDSSLTLPVEYPFKEKTSEDLIKQITLYMELHLCEQLTVPELCSTFAISSSKLYNLFKKKYDHGALEHFHYLKIESAKSLIREGNMNFTEIAHHLSYGSLQYFSKRFKHLTGMSPMEYATSAKCFSNMPTRKTKTKNQDND